MKTGPGISLPGDKHLYTAIPCKSIWQICSTVELLGSASELDFFGIANYTVFVTWTCNICANPLQEAYNPVPGEGDYKSLQGDYTPVQGDYKPVQGDYTPAQGDYKPVQGNTTPVIGEYNHVQGNNTPVQGGRVTPPKDAWTAGYLYINI